MGWGLSCRVEVDAADRAVMAGAGAADGPAVTTSRNAKLSSTWLSSLINGCASSSWAVERVE